MQEFFSTILPEEKIQQKEIDSYYIYIITCLPIDLWEQKISLQTKDNEINIENVFEVIQYFNNKKYKEIIHKILINKKELNLQIVCSDKRWDLNLIGDKIETGKRVLFGDLEINIKYSKHFYTFFHFLCEDKDDDKKVILKNLNKYEKLKIYMEYFKKIYRKYLKEKKTIDNFIKINLVETFIEIFKEKENEYEYSFILDCFSFSFFSKTTFDFLDIFPKLNLQFNELENNIFDSILIIYNNFKNTFLEQFKKSFLETKNKEQNNLEKYNRLLEDFITIYQLFYEDSSKIEKERLIKAKPMVIELINNKPNIFNYLSFILDKYEPILKILTSDKKETIILDSKLIANVSFELSNFQSFNQLLLENEEKYGTILNLYKIGEFFLKKYIRKNEIVEYSNIIEIFNLMFDTKGITIFLDNFPKLSYEFNKFNNPKFNKILKLYKNDKTSFIARNRTFFSNRAKSKQEKQIIEFYINLLESFMNIYQLFYEDSKKIDNKKLITARPTLIKLINNKNDLINYMTFIINHFEKFLIAFHKDTIIVESKLIEEKSFNLINFKNLYQQVIEKEKSSEFFLNFSQIFDYLYKNKYIKEYKNLVIFKKIYEEELKKYPNKDFENKIRQSIHFSGLDKIYKEKQSNAFLLQFIANNDYYKDKKFKKNENKDINLLKLFNIEEMNEGFWIKFKNYKIYSFFEENLKKYFEIFYSKINKVQYFDYFFKLLPPEKYDKNTIELVYNWLVENINTFSKEDFSVLSNGMKTFLDIMLNKKFNSERIFNLFEILKNNLGENYKFLIIFLLNMTHNCNNEEVIKYMIQFLIFPNKAEIETNNLNDNLFENIIIFIKEINQEKLKTKIFLSEIKNLSISEKDFYQDSKKFELFEILLKNDDYSYENNEKSIYWQNCKSECLHLAQDLKEMNIPYLKYKNAVSLVDGDEKMLERITSIFKCLKEKNYQDLAIDVKDKIYKAIQKIEQNLKEIEDLKIFNNFINYNMSSINNELSNYNKRIVTLPINNIYSEKTKKEYNNFERDIKKSKEILPLRKSFTFLCIFNNFKKKLEGEKALEKALEKMKNIKNIFKNNDKTIEKELKNNYDQTKYLINLGYESEEKLSKEIDWLLNYFQIKNYDKKPIIKIIKIFIENKSLFSIISGIQILFDNYKYISNKKTLDKEEDKFDKKLKEYYNLFKNEEIISIEQINKINENIIKCFNINPKNKNQFSQFFIELNQCPDCISFIMDKKQEEVKTLFDYLLDNKDIILNEIDKSDFLKAIQFFEGIKNSKECLISFFSFANQIIKGSMDDFLCGKSLTNYILKFSFIKKLFEKYLKHSEEFFRDAIHIMNRSEFKISLDKMKGIYTIKGNYYKKDIYSKEQKKEIPAYANLVYLNQRVVIEKRNKDFENFNNFFSDITKIIDILNILYEKGYHECFNFEIIINNNKIKCCFQCITYSIEEFIKEILNLKNNITIILNDFYKNNKIIRLFYGRQLNVIYKYIKKYIEKKEKQNIDLIDVISNHLIKGEIPKNYAFNFGNLKQCNEYKEILSEISFYFQNSLNLNKKTIDNIYNFNKIIENKKKKNKNYKGIYFYVTDKEQEIESLKIYNELTGNLPIYIFFLYCTKDLRFEELFSFLLRCLFCEYNCLFCIINTDLLNITLRRKFIYLIKEISKRYSKTIESCLLIILNNKDDSLHKILLKIKNIQILPSPPEDSKFSFDKNFESYLINSSYCGEGKTDKIRDGIFNKDFKKKNNKRTYIYFPLG